jgi:5-methylcytosine-specific restriction protein B
MTTADPAAGPANANVVPVYQDYMNPILAALRSAGRPLLIEELDQRVLSQMALSAEVVAVPHDPEKSERSEVSYRMAWARTYLKKAGLLSNPRIGTWALTDEGRTCGEVDARLLSAEVVRNARGETDVPDADDAEPAVNRHLESESGTARALTAGLRETHAALLIGGELLPRENIEQQLRRFREQFGPEVLSRLDGEALLVKMHGRGTKDSLVYWLEFKNDSEFGGQFGGIGGGTALKFGMYQAAETGAWMTGSGRGLEVLSTEQAVVRARGHRDQLERGVELLESYATNPVGRDFVALQAEMQRVAPELAESSWGHKYFSLIVPAVIGPFHGFDYQNYQLIKLLRVPGRGRYENAGLFLDAAAPLGMTLYELGATLLRRHGTPHGYWRIGTTEGEQSEWDRMREGGFAAIGWAALGDLTATEHDKVSKDHVRERMQEQYPSQAGTVTSAANQVFAFVTRAKERDLVLAMDGMTVRGIGRVQGEYYFQADDGPFPHRRLVEWLSTDEWKLPTVEGPRRTFHPLGKYPANLIEAEARLLGSRLPKTPIVRPPQAPGLSPPPPLEERLARIHSILQRKRQAILYGPPGTGKTYWADRAVRELSARSWFGASYDSLLPERRSELESGGAIELCTFHPAYGYEDFLEGYRPAPRDHDVTFVLRDGVFKRLCQRARLQSKRDYFLVIDEINRGDIPRIFGELLTVLEHDKRGKAVTLPCSGEPLVVPPNVFLVGTMNTADRSIALLDAALRRRFGFIELLPDSSALGNATVGGLPLGAWLDALNQRVVRHVGRDARNLQVGHSYLMAGGAAVKEVSRFAEVLRDDIIPLLEEYCYEDFGALEQILGPALVRRTEQRINDALFAPDRHADLVEALRSAFPEIATTPRAVAAEIAPADDLDADDDEDADPTSAATEATPASAVR